MVYQKLKDCILTKLTELAEQGGPICSDVLCATFLSMVGGGPVRQGLFLLGWRLNTRLILDPQQRELEKLKALVSEMDTSLEQYESLLEHYEKRLHQYAGDSDEDPPN